MRAQRVLQKREEVKIVANRRQPDAKAEFRTDEFRGIIDEVRRNSWATIEKSPGVGFCSIAAIGVVLVACC